TDKDGKPLLSWRVAILPYIDQQELYNEFHLDEPWDSAHNKTLIERMPRIYQPLHGKAAPFTTFYQVFVGNGAAFEKDESVDFAQFTDGTSNTLLAVEAGKAAPRTNPQDIA